MPAIPHDGRCPETPNHPEHAGMASSSIPTEGDAPARSIDSTTGGLALYDRGGQRLSVWRIPQWPGSRSLATGNLPASAIGANRSWAAGWNRFGALVLYDPVDGTVRRVLDRAARSGGGGRSVASL